MAPVATFSDFPDEIILEVIKNYDTIRSFETQATAFDKKREETTRQRENRMRQRTLHSICLTSHRLRRIATPILYASFIGCTTFEGLEPLRLFHRAISQFKTPGSLHTPLSECVQYVENRLADWQGNSLHEDTSVSGASEMVVEYFQLLSDIVKWSLKLEHLSVVSLETLHASFWKHFQNPGNSWESNYSSLTTLCIQVNTMDTGLKLCGLSEICGSLAAATNITDLRTAGLSAGFSAWPVAFFNDVQRLEFHKCMFQLEEIAEVISFCKQLRHLVCQWAYSEHDGKAPEGFHSSFLKHASTLETLHLDMRHVYFWEGLCASELYFWQPFIALKSFTVSDRDLLEDSLGYVEHPDSALAQALPKNLQKFTLLCGDEDGSNDNLEFDMIFKAKDLVENCKEKLADLEEFHIVYYDIPAACPELTSAFASVNVKFEVLEDTW